MNLDRLCRLADEARALVKPPVAQGDWFKIVNANNDQAELYIYGVIGGNVGEDDLTASTFVKSLRDISAPSINLHINSPGGLVFDGVAIYSALKNHSANVNVSIDGVAASAASFVAMAGDSISIEKSAKMMIHDANGLVIGNAGSMRQMANLLDELSDTIAEIYSDRAGGPVDLWRERMKAETWFSSNEAVEVGLADEIAGENTAASVDNRSQLIRARHFARVGGKN